MATIVGVLLVPLVLGYLGKLVSDEGSTLHDIGDVTGHLAVVHGWLYMVFLIVAALLARQERWKPLFTITTLLAGTIPFVSFWAEHRATKAVRAAHHETV